MKNFKMITVSLWWLMQLAKLYHSAIEITENDEDI
jgi:hypothetical protein